MQAWARNLSTKKLVKRERERERERERGGPYQTPMSFLHNEIPGKFL